MHSRSIFANNYGNTHAVFVKLPFCSPSRQLYEHARTSNKIVPNLSSPIQTPSVHRASQPLRANIHDWRILNLELGSRRSWRNSTDPVPSPAPPPTGMNLQEYHENVAQMQRLSVQNNIKKPSKLHILLMINQKVPPPPGSSFSFCSLYCQQRARFQFARMPLLDLDSASLRWHFFPPVLSSVHPGRYQPHRLDWNSATTSDPKKIQGSQCFPEDERTRLER